MGKKAKKLITDDDLVVIIEKYLDERWAKPIGPNNEAPTESDLEAHAIELGIEGAQLDRVLDQMYERPGRRLLATGDPNNLTLKIVEVEPDEDPEAGEPNDAEAPARADDPGPDHLGTPTRYLRHTLTAAEREELRVEREEEDARIEQLTADLESLKKQAKHTANEIEILASKGLEKSRVIRLGWRMQDVPCEERRELDKREDSPTKDKLVMVTYRLDTFEAIDWRPLTYAERQGVLFDEAPAKTPSNGVEVRGAHGAAMAEAAHLLSEAVSP